MKHRRKGRIAAWLLTAALLINGTVPGTPFVSRALAAENTVTITPAQSADADPSRTGTGQMTVSLKIKGAIQPSVTLEGWTKGDTPKTPVVTGNTGNGTVTITYQVNKSGDYTSDVPTTAGTHSVKVTIAESADYLGGEATADFVIAPADTTSQMAITLDIHKHSFTYAANGARITATCGETGGTCDLTGRAVSFTLTAPAKTKDIDSNSAEATLSSTELAAFNQATGLNVSAQDIKYVGRGNTAYAESATAPTVAGTYTAKVTVGTGENTATATVDYTIASSTKTASMTITLVIKNTPSVTAPEAKTLTYDGTTQELVTSGSTNDGTIKYAIGDDDTTAPAEDAFTATVPTRKNAGTYYVWYLVKGNDGYKDVAPACVPVTIAKANAAVTAPTANTLTYNGQDQALVSGGATQDGTLQYAIGTSATTAPTTGFGTAIPSGKTAGTYYVWYKVVGDSNHNDSIPDRIPATIGKRAATITADAKSKVYGEADPTLTATVTGTVGSDTLNYNLNRAAGENAADYTITVTASAEANPNYDITATNGIFTITKREVVVSGIVAVDKNYDGTNTASLDFSKASFANLVAADAGKLSVTAKGTFADEKIGKDKKVTISDLALSGDAAGNYVLAAEGQQTESKADISNMAATDSADGRFRTEVKDFEGFKAQVTGLDLELAKSLCTPAELAAYEAGGKLELELEVGLAGAAMTGDVVELVTNAVKNQKQAKLDGALYLDITLYKVVNGVRTKVTNLSGKSINIKLSVPGDMENRIWENRRTFYAVRVHSGVATVLSETTSMEIPFSTDCFSVYAIAYADVQVITYDTTKTTAIGNNTVTTAVVAPKTDGTDETARTILVFGTAFAMAAIAINVYVFRRRKEEEE